jgi:hypothetical protein
MDYKRFYLKVRSVYPFVERELNPPACLTDWSKMPAVLSKYCTITGATVDQVNKNNSDHRTKFIAVVCKLADPLFFQHHYSINYKLRSNIADATGCTNYQISHTLRKVRNYLSVYEDYRREVSDIYVQMCDNLK